MDEKILKDAQYRKGLSIAFFNATNAAIELVKSRPIADIDIKEALKLVTEVRDFFLDEHKEYYARVIAKVGTSYNPAETIKKLKATKTLEELRKAWQLLSEDERQDVEIKKEVKALKVKHEKT